MVLKMVEQRLCDRCERPGQQVTITWQGGQVVCDLCHTHLDELIGSAPVIDRARALLGSDPVDIPEIQRPERPPAAIVRAWAKEAGIEVPPRGRINSDIYLAYAKAHA